jgi:hypothetical protein
VIPDLYGLLGVSPVAAAAAIRAAFLKIAKECHPDVTGSMSAEAQAAAATRFRDTQRAYEILMDPDRRSFYDELILAGFDDATDTGSTHPPAPPPTEPPPPRSGHATGAGDRATNGPREAGPSPTGACEVCGSTPAAPILLKRNVGLFIARRSYTLEAVLCASCAQIAARRFQVESLTKGWFGVASAPINVWNLAANSARASSHRSRVSDPPSSTPTGITAGWYSDPTGRHTQRYFNVGGRWERLCRDETGREVRDLNDDIARYGPPGSPPPPEPQEQSVGAPAAPGAGRNGAGWYTDPTGKFALRYFNASRQWERLCKTTEGHEVKDLETNPQRLPPP